MQLRDLFDTLPVTPSEVIPLTLQQLLRAELLVEEDWQQAEHLLLTARRELPEQVEVLIALYKLYAYSNRFEESLNLIEEVLEKSASLAGFSPNWNELSADSADWTPASGALRHYLYSLKAMGFVCLRKGEPEQALQVLKKLLELDPQDQVGGSVVFELAESICEEE